MTPAPAHLVARRERQRARRRRRRAALAVAVLVAAAVGVALTSLPSADRTPTGVKAQAPSPQAAIPPVSSSRRRPTHHGASESRVAAAELRRLLSLGLPVYCGGRRGNEVAFTFDDGPGPYTSLALKKLAQAHERATFFVVGKSTHLFPGYLPRELKLAALGDHTFTHPDLVMLPPSEITAQISQTAQLIHAQSGEHVKLFRPPYEARNATVDRIAQQLGLVEILWSVDSRDWFGYDWSQIIFTVEAGLRPGAIVLMHENHGQTIRALTTLLPYLHRHHLRSVSVPELLASDPPSPGQLREGLRGCGVSAGTTRGGPAGA